MSNVFVGQIVQFGFQFAPRGYAYCNGATQSISQNTALFSLLGTTYGGNGTTTFAVPDLRGRTAIGQFQGPGLSNYPLGAVTGTETVTLTTQQLPAHTHSLNVSTTKATTSTPASGSILGRARDGATNPAAQPEIYAPAGTAVDTALGNTSIGVAGNNQPVPNLQPLLAINYCIATQGIFPSRN